MLPVVCGVSQQMERETAKKYELWDLVEKEDLVDCGDKDIEEWALTLLKDYTIYAYAFFRDPKHPKKRFKLYPYQDLIINDTNKRILFAAANQIGKSITLCVKALIYALQNPGKTVIMVSKTLPQSKDLLRQIRSFLQTSTLDYDASTETKMEIYFNHYEIKDGKKVELPQSRIICVPATEAALGYAADMALVDEEAFFENGEYFYNQILQPRTYTTKGQIVIFSNPNGQQGIFWDQWNDPIFSRYKFNFLDCPTNTQEEFDRLAANLTREQIDSTLLAEFTSPEGGFLTLAERKNMQDETLNNAIPSILTAPLYIFFDWAKSQDRTVRITAMPVHGSDRDWADSVRIIEMKEYNQNTSYSDIIDVDLRQLISSVGIKNIAMVGWDNTGVGKGLEDFVNRVQQLGIQAMPVEFSLQNKSRIYTLFKLLAEQRRIKMPYIKECDKQLSMLRFKKSVRGNLQVHHQNERDRDDFPDAIAGVCSLIIQPETPPVTAVII